MNQTQEVGYVVSNRDFLVHLDGFPTIQIFDLVQSDSGLRGWVNSLLPSHIEVLMLDEGPITPRQMFKKSNEKLGLFAGDFLLGRAINPLGVPIDGRGPLTKSRSSVFMELDQIAPGIETREFISTQFLTGITLIDSLLPIGRGQRELVIGDAHSGKTSVLLDAIINQKNNGTVCVYASIGKPTVTVRNLIDTLRANEALGFTVVVAASSADPAPLIYLAPKTAFTVAEFFQKKGHHVLLILDDMGIHAKIYREIGLLSGMPPGRESYPGDTFHQQAYLMERAGNFNASAGGGSITALPVVELNLNDFTSLLPTNLMSMTDGHLLFKSSLYNQGRRPAIDIFLSVSRVGRQTQNPVLNLLSARVRRLLSQAQDLETVSRFSAELSPETQLILKRRVLFEEMLKQEPFSVLPVPVQAILLSLPLTSFLEGRDGKFVDKYKKTLIQAFLKDPALSKITKMVEKLKSDEELIKLLEGVAPILARLCP